MDGGTRSLGEGPPEYGQIQSRQICLGTPIYMRWTLPIVFMSRGLRP